MILVMYKDGRNARVSASLLGQLIQKGEISHFRRASGWVEVSRDPVRKHFTPLFSGQEKRGNWRTHLD